MTNPIAPGQVSSPVTALEQEVRDLRRMVEELSRKDLSNANVGQGGRLRGMYANGQEAFQFGKDPVDGNNKARIGYSDGTPAIGIGPGGAFYGGQETLVVRDLAGSPILGTDELAGFGLSHPGLAYPIASVFEATYANGATISGEFAVAVGGFMFYHPVLWFKGLIRASVNWTLRCVVTDPSGAIVASSSSTPTQANNQYYERMVQLPQSAVCAQNYSASVLITPAAATTTISCWPQPTMGTTLGYYNVRTDTH
jgi:hypothetical protein